MNGRALILSGVRAAVALGVAAPVACGQPTSTADAGTRLTFENEPDSGSLSDAGSAVDAGGSADAGAIDAGFMLIDAGSGTAMVSGSDLGHMMQAASVLATPGPGQADTIVISTTPNVCDEYQDAETLSGAQYLVLQLPAMAFSYPATYDVTLGDPEGGPGTQYLGYSSCVMTWDIKPLSASTVTITAANPTPGGSVSGSFTLTFGDETTMSGTFDAPYCPIDFATQMACH
jgi:hypothetical protein